MQRESSAGRQNRSEDAEGVRQIVRTEMTMQASVRGFHVSLADGDQHAMANWRKLSKSALVHVHPCRSSSLEGSRRSSEPKSMRFASHTALFFSSGDPSRSLLSILHDSSHPHVSCHAPLRPDSSSNPCHSEVTSSATPRITNNGTSSPRPHC